MQNDNAKLKIVFFGSSKYVIPIIEVLRKKYELVLVLTTENLPASQGEALRGYTVIGYCIEHTIPYLSVKQFNNETIQQLRGANAPLGVLAYFGLILPKDVLELFPKGILNVHPSLLPEYRGPTPGQTAILNGETKTGVTLIKLDEEVDHGPVLATKVGPISPTDTSETLYKRLFAEGAKLLEKNISDYLNSKSVQKEQDHSKATFTHHLSRQDGFFDIAQPPSPEKLDRMIRSYHPWPGAWTRFPMRSDLKGGLTSQGRIIKFLPEKRIQLEGGRPMTYKDFLNGYPEVKPQLAKLGLWEG